MIKLIVAVDRDNAIGWKSGALPWHIKEDLQRFKALTTGNDIVMGRKTFESLNRPGGLPHRHNHVISRTRTTNFLGTQPWFYPNFMDFVQAHQTVIGGIPPVLWVIGGAQIYKQALDAGIVDEIHLTSVKSSSGADVHFPYDLRNLDVFCQEQEALGIKWTLVNTEESQEHAEFEFLTLKRET